MPILFLGLLTLGIFPSLAHWSSSWLGFFPLLFLFACFAMGLLGWGRWLESRFGGGWPGIFSYATLVAFLWPFLLGTFGLLGEKFRWLFLAFLALGLWLGHKKRAEKFLSFEKSWAIILLMIAVGIRVFAAYVPQSHGDPLLYHLMGPRLWYAYGSVRLFPDLPNAILASTWEYLYLWPQALWSRGGSVEGLVVAQIFSQWMHLLFGWLGCAVLVERIFRDYLKGDAARLALLFATLFVASIQWTGGLAKNDCGIAFWALASFFFFREGRRASDYFFAGVFTGLAIAGKVSAVLFLLPAYFLVLLPLSFVGVKKWRSFFVLILWTAFGFALSALPIYWRNWRETENPFFPMFAKLFPSPWISGSWADHFADVQPSGAGGFLNLLLVRFFEILHENPAMYGFFLAPFFLWKIRSKDLQWLMIICSSSVLLFVFGFGRNAELRYLGGTLILMAGLGVWAFLQLGNFFPSRIKNMWPFLLVAIFLATSHLPTHLLWKFLRIAPGEKFLLTHTAGDAKDWLRANVQPSQLVVLNADNETYYLSMMRVAVITERPDIDRATYKVQDFTAFLRGLCGASHADYLLDARSSMGLTVRFPGAPLSGAIAYRGQSSSVYDLKKLQSLVSPVDMGCGRQSR